MIIDLCLVACDLNEDYLDFFPLIFKSWFNIVGLDVKMVLISDFIPENLSEYKDHIILFKPIDNIPTPFQAQCIRVLYPCMFNDKNIIISDMDLIPLNKTYYIDNIKNYDNDTFVVYRNVLEDINQYPICFCTANSYIWKEIFNINTEDDVRNTLNKWYSEIPENDYKISSPYSIGWALDQLQLYRRVNTWGKKIIKLQDEDTLFNRLDRSDIDYITSNRDEVKNNINKGLYSDFHLPKPYRKHNDILTYLTLPVL